MDQPYITIDRRKAGLERPVSFCAIDDLSVLPVSERYSITMVTSGSCIILINGERLSIEAPSTLCLSPYYDF